MRDAAVMNPLIGCTAQCGRSSAGCRGEVAQSMIKIDNFTFVQVESEELREAVFRLRYEVYTEEFGFLLEKDYYDKNDYRKRLERDIFEPSSIHFAALNENNDVVGTLRLILNSKEGFPIQHAVEDLRFIGTMPSPVRIAEISRLAVSRRYRRRQEDGFYGVESYLLKSQGGILRSDSPLPQEDTRRKRPVIVLGLYRMMYHVSKRRNITHWYLITEDKLHYVLKKYGFIFHQIGDPVDYHGLRTPYLGIVEDMERKLYAEKPDVLRLMLMGLEKEYHPHFLK